MLNVAFFVRHENFLHPKLGNLQEVFRESVNIYTVIVSGVLGRMPGWLLSPRLALAFGQSVDPV